MAITPVINTGKPAKSGGGGMWGSIGSLGGAGLGAIIGSFTPAGPLGGAQIGQGVGQAAGVIGGNALDPAKAGAAEGGPAPIQGRKMDIAMKIPEVQMAQMQRSKQLLANSSVPNALQYMSMIDQAQSKLKEQLAGTTVGNSGRAG